MYQTPDKYLNLVVSDISCVARFWKFDEAAAAVALVDEVAGASIAATTVETTAGTPAWAINVLVGSSTTDGVITGTLPDLTNKDFAVLALYKPQTNSVLRFGTTGGEGFSLSVSAASSVNGASGNRLLGSLSTATVVNKCLLLNKVTAGAVLYQAAIGADLSAGAKAVADATALGNCAPAAVSKMYVTATTTLKQVVGMMIMTWAADTAPSDIITAADWMMEQWYSSGLTHKPVYAQYAED